MKSEFCIWFLGYSKSRSKYSLSSLIQVISGASCYAKANVSLLYMNFVHWLCNHLWAAQGGYFCSYSNCIDIIILKQLLFFTTAST